MFIDPPLEDGTEAPLSQYAVGAEIPGGGFEIAEGEAPQFGRLQDLILPTRSQRRRRWGYPAARTTQPISIFAIIPRVYTCVRQTRPFQLQSKLINLFFQPRKAPIDDKVI